MNQKYAKLRWACYTSNLAMSIVANLPPLLFLTFRSRYGLSYSLLGLLVTINFFTQLTIDLILSFFGHKFNMEKTVRFVPVFSVVGLIMYALSPVLFPQNVYLGLVVGTVLFSFSSGLTEVLISPVIAAIPAPDPDREMSRLHSVYAWGSVGVVIGGTLFLLAFGTASWQWLAGMLALVPLCSVILFRMTDIPKMETPEKLSGVMAFFRKPMLWLFIGAIFLGGASELSMAQWASGYLEKVADIPKVWGDVFGVAMFSVMMGVGRTAYAKYGKNLEVILLLSGVGATVCYLTAVVCNVPVVGLIACALTGLCVTMMWPGTLVVAAEKFPAGGVFIYAIMASAGDMGAALGPQLVGVVTDAVMAHPSAAQLASELALSPEQLGMKAGMLAATLFPLVSIAVFGVLFRLKRKEVKKA